MSSHHMEEVCSAERQRGRRGAHTWEGPKQDSTQETITERGLVLTTQLGHTEELVLGNASFVVASERERWRWMIHEVKVYAVVLREICPLQMTNHSKVAGVICWEQGREGVELSC